MKPINICGITGLKVAANTTSGVLGQGRYDVYAKDLAVIRVARADKMTGLSADNGYTIPAGGVIPMIIDQDKMCIKSTSAIVVHNVGVE